MSKNFNESYDPAEKVERMNRVFDHVVLPVIAAVIVLSVITAFILRPSCGEKAENGRPAQTDQADIQQKLDAYLMREVLLDDMENNRGIFELGGYTVVETEQSGLVAFRQLDEYTQIFENVSDSSGGRYSAVVYEKDSLSVTVRIYSESIFLVEAANETQSVSAVFRDDRFTTWTSGSEAGAAEVLALVSAEKLAGLTEQYKQNILSLVQ